MDIRSIKKFSKTCGGHSFGLGQWATYIGDYKMNKKFIQKDTKRFYVFRGEINFEHLTFDCIEDGKFAFIAVAKNCTYMGLRQDYAGGYGKAPVREFNGFAIYEFHKKNTGEIIKDLKTLQRAIKVRRGKVAKRLSRQKQAGKFSNQPETKVMVF